MKKLFFSLLLLSGTVFGTEFSVSTVSQFREALAIAEDNNESDIIYLQSGIYSTMYDNGGTFTFTSSEENGDLKIVGNGEMPKFLGMSKRIFQFQTASTIEIDNLFLTGAFGNAIYISGDLVVKNSTLENNTDGSAINMEDGANLTTFNSTFKSNNRAIYAEKNSNVLILNSTFDRNYRHSSGGAILSHSSTNSVKIANSVFTNNRAYDPSGGAIYSYSNLIILNSIFINNSSTSSYSPSQNIYGEEFTTLYNNYIDLAKVYGKTVLVDNLTPTDEINSTFNSDFSLKASSPLIDAGADLEILKSLLGEKALPYLQIDGNCNERVVNGVPDIGVFEYGGVEENSCQNFTMSENNQSVPETCPLGFVLDGSLCVATEHIENGTGENQIETNKEAETTLISLQTGWNLISIDTNLSEISDEVSIIWQFTDGNWSAFSPSGEFTSDISRQGVPTISENLSSKDGVWFKSESDIDLENFPPKVSDELPTVPSLSGKLGWNLMGTDRTIPAKALSCKNSKKGNVWKFVDNDWLLFVEDINPMNFPSMFNVIHAHEGFWLQCQ
jgi:predicted outer membrane repeat protein